MKSASHFCSRLKSEGPVTCMSFSFFFFFNVVCWLHAVCSDSHIDRKMLARAAPVRFMRLSNDSSPAGKLLQCVMCGAQHALRTEPVPTACAGQGGKVLIGGDGCPYRVSPGIRRQMLMCDQAAKTHAAPLHASPLLDRCVILSRADQP